MRGRKLAPDRAKPYLYLGRLALAEERGEVAEKMFGRAVQLDPDCLDALRELRLINMRREKAKSLVQRILRR
jgi:cytochrome c-type biogenesis protein CcmH/NrfG